MPLIIVSGLPTSGKTTRAKQLQAYLAARIAGADAKYRLHLISDTSLSIDRAVYDLSPSKLPAHTRSANASEKDARAAIYGAVKRVLSARDIVILDGLNYIKGWRYQLYCEAKALATPSVVLQIGCSVERARGVNEERLKRQATKDNTTEADASTEDGGQSSAVTEDEEQAYDAANWDNLVFRYEEPNPMTRWDSPLFTLIWEDDSSQSEAVFANIWDTIAGSARKVIKPNQATVQRPVAGGDHLYILDRETQEIVKRILEQQDEDGGGGEVKGSRGGAAGGELVVEMPSTKIGLPQLQRLRRAFVGLNRGGIGLDGMGSSSVEGMREGFVGYLNDAFGKDG